VLAECILPKTPTPPLSGLKTKKKKRLGGQLPQIQKGGPCEKKPGPNGKNGKIKEILLRERVRNQTLKRPFKQEKVPGGKEGILQG